MFGGDDHIIIFDINHFGIILIYYLYIGPSVEDAHSHDIYMGPVEYMTMAVMRRAIPRLVKQDGMITMGAWASFGHPNLRILSFRTLKILGE